MRRQRKEIFAKMRELDIEAQIEHDLSFGIGDSEVAKELAPKRQRLQDELIASYGVTADEYEAMRYEGIRKAGVLPFC